jgi:hypothetical protein
MTSFLTTHFYLLYQVGVIIVDVMEHGDSDDIEVTVAPLETGAVAVVETVDDAAVVGVVVVVRCDGRVA